MGIMDFVRGGVQEMMVARGDQYKHLIVYKHPNSNVPMYAQLTVDMDECAVFFKSGNPPVTCVFPPGRHTLSTQNIPFLNHFITQFTGGNVLQAEVFFVKTQPVRGLTFGGQLMAMKDPEFDLSVRPRAYGTYALIVTEPAKFIIGYTGQAAQGDNEAIAGWLRQKMFQVLGKTLQGFFSAGTASFRNLGGVDQDLAQALGANAPDFTEIGCRILEVGELKISLSPEDEQRFRELDQQVGQATVDAIVARKKIAVAQAEAQAKQFALDQRFAQDSRYVQQLAGSYQSYAAGQALIGAGEGMAQGGADVGGAAVGAQMAAGMMMGQAMGQGMAGPRGPQFPVPQGAPAPGAPTAAGGAVPCPKCGAQVPSGKFCAECGTPLAVAPARKFCTGCGAELQGAKFCPSCGTAAA